MKRTTAKRILASALPYIWPLCLLLLIVVVGAVIGIVSPLIYRRIIDEGILKRNSHLIIHLAILVAVLGLFDAALGLVQTYLSATIGARIVLDLRVRLFEHIQQMPLAFFIRTKTGALVTRVNNDVSGAQTAFTEVISNVVGNLLTVILVISAMFVLSWRITLVSIILPPLFIFPARLLGRKLQTIARANYDLIASMSSFLTERFNVAGAQLAKLCGRLDHERAAFKTCAIGVSQTGITNAVYARFFFSFLFLTASFSTALTYGWGGLLAAKHDLDVGSVVALATYLTRLYMPLLGLSNIQVTMMTALVSFERIFEILDLKTTIVEKPDAISLPPGPATLSFNSVSFRHSFASDVYLPSPDPVADISAPADSCMLTDITFTVNPRHMLAIVGHSGAGKSTIAQLATRLHDVQSGSVTIDGFDIRDLKIDSLYRRIGIVTQDTYFFHDTIRANLLYAKPTATDLEITDALRSAQLLPLIATLPKGIDTIVGEQGYRFSGGEKQRLAIARLLLKAPEIVILDEATSHLDSKSEAAIQVALDVVLVDRTSIVIAHRFSTILKADQIVVMHEGRIVQRGTHSELLIQPGIYADLYHKQNANSHT